MLNHSHFLGKGAMSSHPEETQVTLILITRPYPKRIQKTGILEKPQHYLFQGGGNLRNPQDP